MKLRIHCSYCQIKRTCSNFGVCLREFSYAYSQHKVEVLPPKKVTPEKVVTILGPSPSKKAR